MQQPASDEIGKMSERAAAICVTFIAMAGFLVLPLFLGAAAGEYDLTQQQIGLLASAVGGMSAIGSIVMMLIVRRVAWRPTTRIAFAVLIAGMAASLFVDNAVAFIACQGIAALGGGAAYSLAITVLSDSRNPDRDFGFSVAAQVAFQVAGMALLPGIIENKGLTGVISILIAFQAAGLLLSSFLPQHGRAVQQGSLGGRILTAPVLLAFAGCFFFFANVGAVWAYIERIAVLAEIAPGDIGKSLAIGVAAGIPGALLASALGERFGRLAPLTISAIGTVAALALLGPSMSLVGYIIAAVLYNFVWNFSLTYQYAGVNAVDRSGRAIAMAPAFHGAGAAVGPGVAAMFVTEQSLAAVNIFASASVIISLACFALAIMLARRGAGNIAATQVAPAERGA